jgi:phage terminase small subunit
VARFVAEYLKDHNGTKAAIRAGYSAKSAHVQASQLLKIPKVAAAVEDGEERLRKQDAEYITKLRRENAMIALFDPASVMDHRGNILAMKDWPPEARAAVSSVEWVMKNARAGDGVTDRVLKLRFWNKNHAIELDYEAYGLTEKPDPNEGQPDVPAFILPPGSKVSIT